MVGDPAAPGSPAPEAVAARHPAPRPVPHHPPAVPEPRGPRPDAGFAVVRKGYDQDQVDAHLARLDAEVRILATDRLAAVDQSDQLTRELDESRARTDRLRAQVRTLVSPPQSVQGMSERMRSMLRLAEDEVAEMLTRAETEVNQRVRDADVRAAQVVAQAHAEADAVVVAARSDAERAAADATHHRATFETEQATAAAALAAERADIERQVADVVGCAEQERAAAWAESEARRATVEEDFALAMNQRREEALAALATEQLRAREEIEERRRASESAARDERERAQETARRIVADAERRLGELTALRRRIVEQLGGTRSALERSITALDPLPEERADADAAAAGRPRGSSGDAPTPTRRPRPTADLRSS